MLQRLLACKENEMVDDGWLTTTSTFSTTKNPLESYDGFLDELNDEMIMDYDNIFVESGFKSFSCSVVLLFTI